MDSLLLPVRLLFFSTPDWTTETQFIFSNYSWTIDRHELEMNVGWVTLLLLVFGVVRSRLKIFMPGNVNQRIALSLLIVLLAIPVALNFYSPAWNEFLKSIPIVKSFSLFVRLYAVYIPLAALLAALSFSLVQGARLYVGGAAILMIVVSHWATDKTYYEQQDFDPAMLLDHYEVFSRDKTRIPAISQVTNIAMAQYGDEVVIVHNETFVYGASNINCKNDMFGYRLESFPQVQRLIPEAPVDRLHKGTFNLKNPACYVFPEENQCEPGDHFRSDQAEQLNTFVHYKNFDFKMPWYQRAANWISAITFVACIALLSLIWGRMLSQKLKQRPTLG